MARIVQIVLSDPNDNPLGILTTSYSLAIPATVWDEFLARMVRRNETMGEAVTEALSYWAVADRWEQPIKEETP